jgi:hypothetical protein
MSTAADDQRDEGARRLAAHVDECGECRESPPPIARIARHLATGDLHFDIADLSRRTLAYVRPELERRARMLVWRRVAAGIVLALLPLPVVLAYDALVLRLLYGAVSAVLPSTVAVYVVASYTAVLALLFAATYAAIPILVTRPHGGREPAVG